MANYRDHGWDVKDVRYGNPYDATATKDGHTLWLEAKGTETKGTAVIVTRGELQWAREHPGDCIPASCPTSHSCPTAKSTRRPGRSACSPGARTAARSPPATSTTHLPMHTARTDAGHPQANPQRTCSCDVVALDRMPR
jgi:hypothetical protein